MLAFDTTNEIIAIGLGVLHASSRMIRLTASVEAEGSTRVEHPAAARIDTALAEHGVAREDIACVAVEPRPRIVHGRAHRDGYGEGHRVSTRGAAGWRIVA